MVCVLCFLDCIGRRFCGLGHCMGLLYGRRGVLVNEGCMGPVDDGGGALFLRGGVVW